MLARFDALQQFVFEIQEAYSFEANAQRHGFSKARRDEHAMPLSITEDGKDIPDEIFKQLCAKEDIYKSIMHCYKRLHKGIRLSFDNQDDRVAFLRCARNFEIERPYVVAAQRGTGVSCQPIVDFLEVVRPFVSKHSRI